MPLTSIVCVLERAGYDPGMSNGTWLVELAESKEWGELADDERDEFCTWLDGATCQDLFLLIRHAVSRRPSTAFRAARETGLKKKPEPPEE